jgi:hypothetical protein
MEKTKKTKMRATSILAFSELLETIGEKQTIVFKAIKKIQPCSDKMIADYLGWKINRVTPRRYELAKYHLIIIYKKDIDKIPPFKKVIYWKIPEWMNGMIQ